MFDEKNGRCRVADLRTGEDVGEISAEFDLRGTYGLSPDGRYFVGSHWPDRDKTAIVWSFETGARCAEIEDSFIFGGDRYEFAAPDQLLIVEDSLTETLVSSWDIKLVRQTWRRSIPRYGARSGIDVSPGGKYIAVLAGRTLHIIDSANGSTLETRRLPIPWSQNQPVSCECLRFSPDGSELAAICYVNRLLVCWDMTTGEMVLNRPFARAFVAGDSYEPSHIKWFPDKSGWLLSDRVLVERKTGAPVWTLPDLHSGPLRILGLNSVLTVQAADRNSDKGLVEQQIPRSQFTAAFVAAQRAPSENVPAMTKSDLSAMKSISPPAEINHWDYRADGIAAADVPPKLSITNARATVFQLAAEAPGRLAMQNVISFDPNLGLRPGPRRPLQQSQLTVHDVHTNRALGQIETTGWSEMLDVSPDGSLVLTASAWRHGRPYDRLDVWAPILKKHAIGWCPVVREPALMASQIDRAVFVDKRHVLTHTQAEVVLWELPACKAVYRLAGRSDLVGLSVTRKYFVACSDFRDLLVYETMSGRCVGRLERPESSERVTFPRGWFRPDGKQLAIVYSTPLCSIFVVYDLATGKIRSEFGVPKIGLDGAVWIDQRYLSLQKYPKIRGKKYLLDLQNRALVARYDKGFIHNVGALDGSVWQFVTKQSGAESMFEVRKISFPLPASGPRLEDYAYLYPGADVSVSVTSSSIDRREIEAELSRRLEEVGLRISASAPRRMRLELVDVTEDPRTLTDGRVLSRRSLDLKWTCFDAANRNVWEQKRRVPWGTIDVSRSETASQVNTRAALREKIRETVETLTIPRYLFPKVEELKLPELSLPN